MQRVVVGIGLDEFHARLPLGIAFFQPGKGLILIPQPGMDRCEIRRRHVVVPGPQRELAQNLLGLRPPP